MKTIFSRCRKYRYTLWRSWGALPLGFLEDPHPSYYPGNQNSYVQFIGLNPSTADETKDDPTVRRCIAYAKAWGFGGLCMTNAFAWRDTDPQMMKAAFRPIGELVVGGAYCQMNDRLLLEVSKHAGLVIAAWGKHGTHLDRDRQIVSLIPNLHCLGVNGDGTPKHPLYLPKTAQPIKYSGRDKLNG